MVTCLGNSYSYGLLCVSVVKVYQFLCMHLSPLVSSVGYELCFQLELVNDHMVGKQLFIRFTLRVYRES